MYCISLLQKTKGKGGAAKPTVKVSQKSNVNKEIYDDYAGLEDAYDDYDDDFM